MDGDDQRPTRLGTDTLLEMMQIQGEQLAQLSDIVQRLTEQTAINTKAIASLRAVVETLRERRGTH